MKNYFLPAILLILVLAFYACDENNDEIKKPKVLESGNKSSVKVIETAGDAMSELKEGNKRFLKSQFVNANYHQRIEETKTGQHPHSLVLTCMDSRVPPEIIFDQGIGNIFVVRNAGNIEDENVLGSMEYAVDHAGTKLIVVMGHSHCGAVTGAIHDVKIGNLTQLLEQIKPAIKTDVHDPNVIDDTAKNSIQITINDILSRSEVIRELVQEKKVMLVGAFYDIESGIVTFME